MCWGGEEGEGVGLAGGRGGGRTPPPPPCDIPLGCCFFMGPWTVTRSFLRVLRRVAAFCGLLRPVLFVEPSDLCGLCWMWQDVLFAPPPPNYGLRTKGNHLAEVVRSKPSGPE